MVFQKGHKINLGISRPEMKGKPPWNKGLTKETDERVAGYSKSMKGKKKPILSEKYKGKGNPHYKNGIRTGKRMILEVNKTCQTCGSKNRLEIHHKDKNRNNNDVNNLQLLCRSCHSKQHRGKEWGKKMIKSKMEVKNGRKVPGILCKMPL